MANSTNKPSSGGRKATVATPNSGGSMEQQQRNNDLANGVFSFHSVKRFGGGTPILLLSSAGASSHHENRSSIGRHFIVQTTTSNNQHGGVNSGPTSSSSCLNPRTTARLKVQMAQHQQQQMKTENGRGQQQQMQVHQDSVRSNSQTPIGSGFGRHHHHHQHQQNARQQQQQQQQHHHHGVLYPQQQEYQQAGSARYRNHASALLSHHMSVSAGAVIATSAGSSVPLNANGEPIKLPENLESLPRSDHFPNQRHRWNTNEEIAGILISFDRHTEWQSKEVKIRPKSGSMLLYSRKKVRYRRDGYCWKKRKDGKTTREDHMKLKVQGTECIYGCYVHSAILPTFHRRCYWLLQNPDIVLVHYLNVPYPDDTKMAVITPSLALWTDKKEWTKDELVSQLKPMFFSEDEPDLNNELEISTAETVDAIVSQLMEKQRVARQAALVKQLECGCPDSTCADGKTCSHPMRRITAAAAPNKATDMSINVNGSSTTTTTAAAVASNSRLVGDGGDRPPSRTESSNNQVSSTTGSSPIQLNTSQQQQLLHHHSTQQQQQQQQPRVYTRTDRVVHHHHHHNNNNNSNTTQTQYVHIAATSNNASSNNAGSSNNTTPPLVLSLSQIQNGNAGLIILNSGKGNGEMGFVCNGRKEDFYSSSSKEILNMHQQNQLKQEAMDTTTNPSSSLSLYANLTTIISNDNQKQTTLLNHTDGFMPRQRHYQSEVTRSVTPSMSSKLNHDDVSNNSSSSSSNNIFLDQHNKLTMTMTNQQQQQQLFFNNHETLDLSQEDIQRTLSANMPMSVAGDVLEEAVANSGVAAVVVGCRREEARKESAPAGEGSLMVLRGVGMTYSDISKRQHHHQQVLSPEISTMDFIDPCDDVPSSPNVVDDDVFVNLDAFDMLGEFPDLEVLDPVGHSTLLEASLTASNATSEHPTSPPDNQQHSNSTTADQLAISNDQQQSSTPANTDDTIVKITDYSPEWAYPDGGVKVLVTGPWHLNRSGGYTVLFDAFPVPTTLVQSGVLRCYCPAHEAGLATLQVACDGYVISNSVIFEYKLPAKEEQAIYALEPKVERSNDNLLKFTLLQRLEAMDERLQIKKEPVDSCDLVEDSVLFSKPNLEDRLVSYCQRLTGRLWRHGEELSVDWFASHRGMTLLHLAASLGYSRLVCAILHWRAENSSLLLETEVDALSQDEYGYTPLMWACVKGHTDTAVMLYKWNHTALNIPNHLGQSALECAKMNGFSGLGKSLERLENKREKANQMLLNSCLTSKLEGGGGGESLTTNVGGKLCRAVSSSSSGTMSPAGSVTSVASTSRSHDGVFLRPGAVTTRFVDTSAAAHPKYKSTLNLDSLDSFTPHTTSCVSSDSSSIVKHLLLSSSPSPLLSATTNNPNNRGSCFGQRLSKRTSFDSGIHLNQSAENVVVGSTKTGARGQPIVTGARNMLGSDKVTRFTRSMSLPLQHSTLSQEVEQSFNNCGDGIKKMDFALCEVVTLTQSKRGGQNSPLIDVEAVSSEDDDDEENDLAACVADDDAATAAAAVNAVSGDQDVRVLTLAEQIIAAIPDRIKNESEDMLLDSPSSVAMLHSNDLLSDVLMEPLFDQSSSSFESSDVFELSDYNYRYYDVATPCSSLSPAPSSCLQSPRSFTLDSPSPPPTTADFCEFFQASGGIFENDFSNLTLSDREQRELYEAAKIIQKAYRSYKGRQQQEQNKERAAAILIQNYYRRYKQYAYFKQMTHAAMVIQNGFRSYCEHKRFKKSKEAALCIQNYYRNYKEQGNTAQCTSNRDKNLISDNMSSNSSGSSGLKRTYSQRRQHQAARKIQQFMRQSKNKLQRERAEKEKQLDQSAAVHPLQRLLCPEDNSI